MFGPTIMRAAAKGLFGDIRRVYARGDEENNVKRKNLFFFFLSRFKKKDRIHRPLPFLSRENIFSILQLYLHSSI